MAMPNSENGDPLLKLSLGPDRPVLTWDDRLKILSSQGVCLHLDHFEKFRTDRKELIGNQWGDLRATLDLLTVSQDRPPANSWRRPLGRLAFWVLRSSVGEQRDGGEGKRDHETAKGLLLWLGPESLESGWRLRFDENLRYAQRYRLLSGTVAALARQPTEAKGAQTQAAFSEIELREAYWWTLRCRWELAIEWQRDTGSRDAEARPAVSEAALAYLNLLKDEPHQQDLERFLSECGSSIEIEVKRVLFAYEETWGVRRFFSMECPESPQTNEAVRRVFSSWLLRRYDLKGAEKLILWGRPRRELMAGALCFLAAVVGGFGLFVAQVFFPQELHSWRPSKLFWWGLQVFVQLAALFGMAACTPALFRVLMPRALFGSLLAWLTIILTALPNLEQIWISVGPQTQKTLGRLCFEMMEAHPRLSATIGALPGCALTAVFVLNEVSGYVWKRRHAILRAVRAMICSYLGSLFWGIIFALPINFWLERKSDATCFCLVPIATIGSSLAVLFGILAQLLWENKSMTEPLGEPV